MGDAGTCGYRGIEGLFVFDVGKGIAVALLFGYLLPISSDVGRRMLVRRTVVESDEIRRCFAQLLG